METIKVIADFPFAQRLVESRASTTTGKRFLEGYKTHVLTQPLSCTMINQLLQESSRMTYDPAVNEVAEFCNNYIKENWVSWTLGTIVESVKNSSSAGDYFEKAAVPTLETLLENTEEELRTAICHGALQNYMFIESIRTLVRNLAMNTEQEVTENATYSKRNIVSVTEKIDGGAAFMYNGVVYEVTKDGITEGVLSDRSHTFQMLSKFQTSQYISLDEDTFKVETPVGNYFVEEQGRVRRESSDASQEMTLEELRESNDLILQVALPMQRQKLMETLEPIAVLCENYDMFMKIELASVISSDNDEFLMIESGTQCYATLLGSNHSQMWSINEDVEEVRDFIKEKTRVDLSSHFSEKLEESACKKGEKCKKEREEEEEEQEIQEARKRIEILSEKYKDNPLMLHLIEEQAKQIAELSN